MCKSFIKESLITITCKLRHKARAVPDTLTMPQNILAYLPCLRIFWHAYHNSKYSGTLTMPQNILAC